MHLVRGSLWSCLLYVRNIRASASMGTASNPQCTVSRPYELKSKLPQVGYIEDLMAAIKGETRSLDDPKP